jgi:hypothetical protein
MPARYTAIEPATLKALCQTSSLGSPTRSRLRAEAFALLPASGVLAERELATLLSYDVQMVHRDAQV